MKSLNRINLCARIKVSNRGPSVIPDRPQRGPAGCFPRSGSAQFRGESLLEFLLSFIRVCCIGFITGLGVRRRGSLGLKRPRVSRAPDGLAQKRAPRINDRPVPARLLPTPSPWRRAPVAGGDRGVARSRRRSGDDLAAGREEARHFARTHPDQSVLRGVDPHPVVVRACGKTARGGRDEHGGRRRRASKRARR